MSKAAAMRFLRSEAQSSVETESHATGRSPDDVRLRRVERRQQLRIERKVATRKISDKRLDARAFPIRLRIVTNLDCGWQAPVQVRSITEYSGPPCARAFRDFLPADSVGAMPELMVADEFIRGLENRSGDYRCYLDDHWRFAETEADAYRRKGHEYAGRRNNSMGEILVLAVYDLEAALRYIHPHLPQSAVADFFMSWQVQAHIAEFCRQLAGSGVGAVFGLTPDEAAAEIERCRIHVYRQLAAFAHELQYEVQETGGDTSSISDAGPASPPQRITLPAALPEKKRRAGRPPKIPIERIKEANRLKAAGAKNSKIAQCLYNTKNATERQIRNVPTLLSYHSKKLSPAGNPSLKDRNAKA
jgi:hypothetical protein